MKKTIIFISSIAVMMSFVGCGNSKMNGNSTTREKVTNEARIDGINSFTGVVSKIEGDGMLIIPNEGEDIRSSGDLVAIGITKELGDFKVGDTVKVTYEGGVMESYPLQVKVKSVEIIDSQLNGESSVEDTDSISSDADDSNFVDWKDVLKDSIGEDVRIMLDEYNVKSGSIKVGDSAGVMLPGLMVEGYEWKIDIEDEEVLKFLKSGYEKGVVGERQGSDFFAFKGLKEGETKIKIKILETSTGKVAGEHEFTLKITE